MPRWTIHCDLLGMAPAGVERTPPSASSRQALSVTPGVVAEACAGRVLDAARAGLGFLLLQTMVPARQGFAPDRRQCAFRHVEPRQCGYPQAL